MWALFLVPGPHAFSQGAAVVQTLYYVTTLSEKHNNSTMCAVQLSSLVIWKQPITNIQEQQNYLQMIKESNSL
jgi:hypothetical protein